MFQTFVKMTKPTKIMCHFRCRTNHQHTQIVSRCKAHKKIPSRKPEGEIFLLRSNQLDDSHLSCVAAARTDRVDSCVTTVLVSVLGSDLVEYLLSDIFLSNV